MMNCGVPEGQSVNKGHVSCELYDLGAIDGGGRWLSWATRSCSSRYIQPGQHGSGVHQLWLPRCLLSVSCTILGSVVRRSPIYFAVVHLAALGRSYGHAQRNLWYPGHIWGTGKQGLAVGHMI